MRRYYDPTKKALVYINQQATPEMWDDHWNLKDEEKVRKALNPKMRSFVVSTTRRYLTPQSGLILEGGCGVGQHVAALTQAGFRASGIDFAPHTVSMLNSVAPHLDIRLGDIRSLPLEDESIVGYWSLGVIEHFYSGYDEIIQEMARVITPGGYLFITHPYMSLLRNMKVILKLYEYESNINEPENFYQFALNHHDTVKSLAGLNFRLYKFSHLAGLKGFKDECPNWIKSPLQNLYNYSGKSRDIRALKYLLDRAFNSVSFVCGHSCLLIFRKES